jgi:hypothetical protein
MFFPLGAADKQYAQYVNEDDFYQIGASMSDAEKVQLRQKIIATSALSMGFSMILSPMLTGVYSALTMDRDIFLQFLSFLLAIKFMMLTYSAFEIRKVSFVDISGAFIGVVFLYLFYLLAIWRISLASYDWSSRLVASSGAIGLLYGVIDFVIFEIGIYILVAALAGGAVSYWMTKPTILKVIQQQQQE